MQHYTIKEVSEKLGIGKATIKRLVKTGKILSIKGEARRSPYKIPKTEIEKLKEIARQKTPTEEVKWEETLGQEKKADNSQESKDYRDFIEIQKTLAATMREIAATQEQIASTLKELIKKI
jgi:excisionase family DNA binding protein